MKLRNEPSYLTQKQANCVFVGRERGNCKFCAATCGPESGNRWIFRSHQRAPSTLQGLSYRFLETPFPKLKSGSPKAPRPGRSNAVLPHA